MSGGIIGEMSMAKHSIPMTPGYCDLFGAQSGLWTICSDVYSYGGILIELMTKRITEDDDLRGARVDCTSDWALKIIKSGKSLDVHQSLQEEPSYKVSNGLFLGTRCIEFKPERRPMMAKFVKYLEHLSVVRHHGNGIGL